MKIKKNGDYVRVYIKGNFMAGYNFRIGMYYGATKYFRHLQEWIDGNTMSKGSYDY